MASAARPLPPPSRGPAAGRLHPVDGVGVAHRVQELLLRALGVHLVVVAPAGCGRGSKEGGAQGGEWVCGT